MRLVHVIPMVFLLVSVVVDVCSVVYGVSMPVVYGVVASRCWYG